VKEMSFKSGVKGRGSDRATVYAFKRKNLNYEKSRFCPSLLI